MKWRGRQGSGNIEDRRGGGGKMIGGGLGCGTIVVLIIAYFLGANPMDLIQIAQQQSQNGTQYEQTDGNQARPDDELADFVSVVLKDNEDVWHKIFREQVGQEYVEPKLVLFSGTVQSACGMASAASGPFYCPGDQKVYIDLSFYQELSQRFGAPGDFAMAYVVSHEVGHHVQNLLGITDQVHNLRGRMSEAEYNKYSVRLELQADFFAGVWAHYAQSMKGVVEAGDIDEAINAANAIGDDRLQKQSQGYVVPDAFTHGTSAQRMRWFKKGYETGDINQGDTFAATSL